MPRTIFPKDYIQEVMINEIRELISSHAYLSFFLICAGIEFLGICIDDSSDWFDDNKSKLHFTNSLINLFPVHYRPLTKEMYKNLRCGLLHSTLPRGYSLGELSQNTSISYDEHLIKDNQVIIIDHLYSDFVNACRKVIEMQFSAESKMNKPLMVVG